MFKWCYIGRGDNGRKVWNLAKFTNIKNCSCKWREEKNEGFFLKIVFSKEKMEIG
jgi:hypothetical protein